MEPLVRFISNWTPPKIDLAARTVSMCISSETPDAHGSIIDQDGMSLVSYRKNPIFAWHHPLIDAQPWNPAPTPDIERALGKSIELVRDSAKTWSTFQFLDAETNEKAEKALRMYDDGSLNACSVGLGPSYSTTWFFDEEEELDLLKPAQKEALRSGRADFVITKSELVEVSAVFVGSNPDALAFRCLQSSPQGRALSQMRDSARAKRTLEEAKELLESVKDTAGLRKVAELTVESLEKGSQVTPFMRSVADGSLEKAVRKGLTKARAKAALERFLRD